jgi:hypothetical protein
MPRYRVGEGGVRVTTARGAVYSLPPGAVVDELPDRYEGTLQVVEWTAIDGYDTKVIRPAEDKSL